MTKPAEYDVVVVGAGPAGIAAAVRVRWVKRHLAIPCKVALVDPAPLGGLGLLGTTNLIGPGWIYSATSLRPHFTRDVERFRIPHIRRRAVQIERIDAAFHVRLEGGDELRARTVILCCGMRLLADESRFWKRGISATSLGVEPAAQKISGWLADPRLRHIVFVGSTKLTNLYRFVAAHQRPDCAVTFVVEPTSGFCQPQDRGVPPSCRLVSGTVVELRGEEQLRSVVVARNGYEPVVLDHVDLMVIDFLSYETMPSRSVACDGLKLDAAGFVLVDRRQHTNIDGLFAAGDVTGTPAAVAPAIAEGVVAGFEAYRYVYRQKFAADPLLFAYYGFDRELGPDVREIPEYSPDAFRIELLADPALALRLADRRFWGEDRRIAMAMINRVKDGQSAVSIQGLSEDLQADVECVRRLIERLLRFKQITLQPLPQARVGP